MHPLPLNKGAGRVGLFVRSWKYPGRNYERRIMVGKYGNPWPKYRIYPPKILAPLPAVRHKCLDCCCQLPSEVELCPVEGCHLWPYRFGRYPENHRAPKSVLGPIKKKCKDCAPEPQDAVKNCLKKCCPLWPYRLGKNPKRAGQGLGRGRTPEQMAKMREGRKSRSGL
jgi:hypothetical protein